MKNKIRLAVALIVFAISVALLIWGYAPAPRETRVQYISPAEMQLPAP